MSLEVLSTVMTGAGVLIGVWRIVTVQVGRVRRDLTMQIAAMNTRIDNVLLADRKGCPEEPGRFEVNRHRLPASEPPPRLEEV